MAVGIQDHPLKGHILNLQVRLPKSNSQQVGSLQVQYHVSSSCGIVRQVNPYQRHAGCDGHYHSGMAYTANIGVWSHRSKGTTKIHQATPGFPRPHWGRVPTGFLGRTMSISATRVESRTSSVKGIGHQGITEAVPRTPWLGYGIQPVSGPLTPCTEGKTPVDAPSVP